MYFEWGRRGAEASGSQLCMGMIRRSEGRTELRSVAQRVMTRRLETTSGRGVFTS